MSFLMLELPDIPAIIWTYNGQGNYVDDLGEIMPRIMQWLDQQHQPVFIIVDLTSVHLDLGGHLRAADLTARGPHTPMHHPLVREHLFITTDPMVRSGLMSLASATYGMARISVHDTLEEALNDINARPGTQIDQLTS